MSEYKKDLIVLVADSQMERAMEALLARHDALGCRPIDHEIEQHSGRDSGCFHDAHNFVQPWCGNYRHALVLFDRAFDRKKKLVRQSREDLESTVERNLSRNGWGDRAAAVVIDPELEVWVWGDSREVARCLGWQGRDPDLRSWLRDKGLWSEGSAKPEDPKAAMEAALREVGKPRSANIYKELAQSVDFQRCEDRSFIKLKDTLRKWFARQDW